MIIDPKVGDILMHVKTHRPVKVLEVNDKYGWFKVKFIPGDYTKILTMNAYGESQSFYKITNEERADLFLRLENLGITDAWRD
jgi:hypothetical protein